MTLAVTDLSRPIRIADIEQLSELTTALGSPFSELCAANLFLSRKSHAYRLSLGETSYVLGFTHDGRTHVAPLTPLEDEGLIDLSRRTGVMLYPMSPRTGWVSTFNPDDSDCIFRTAELIEYDGVGRKAAGHQWQRFQQMFQPRDEPFTTRQADTARGILDVWLADIARPRAAADYLACQEAITLFEPLGLVGLVTFTAAGDPAGFILASALGDGSAAIHFAKGKQKYPGILPHLFSRFAQTYGDRFARLNFEQDLSKFGVVPAKRPNGLCRALHKHRLPPPAPLHRRTG
jgi:hypothetical protein